MSTGRVRSSGDVYLAAVDRVVARASVWSLTDANTAVPACPGWSGHDLVAHLAGGAADHVAGRLDGFPGPAWTGRHVAERSGRSTGEVLAELVGHAAQIAARCDQRPAGPNSSWDAYIHEQDLAAAFQSEHRPLDDHGHELLCDITGFIAARTPFDVELARVGNDVQLVVDDGQRYRATVEPYAALRAITGRAGPDAIAGWRWLPAPPPPAVIEQLSLF